MGPATPLPRRRNPATAFDRLRRFRPTRNQALAGAGLVLLLVVIGVISGSRTGPDEGPGGDGAAKPPVRPPAAVPDPRQLLGQEIPVGPAGAFKTLGEALAYVGEHYVPKGRRGRQVIRLAGGVTYPERIDLTGKPAPGRGKPFPEGVHIICTDPRKATLAPVGDEPVLRLEDVQHFALEGLELRAAGPVAVELTGFVEGTRLENLDLTSFGQTGLVGRNVTGTLNEPGRRNEVLLEQLAFRPGGPQAVGMRFEGDTSRVRIARCRFLPPLATGIVFEKAVRYVDVEATILASRDEGIRFVGSGTSPLKEVDLTHNTFFQHNRGLVFAGMPAEDSSDLAFYRNLFDEVAVEALVEANYNQRDFERMLKAGGPEQNWTARSGPMPEGAIDLFSTRGRMGVPVRYESRDPDSPRFLAPAADSPQANVPVAGGNGLQPWVGAVGPVNRATF